MLKNYNIKHLYIRLKIENNKKNFNFFLLL